MKPVRGAKPLDQALSEFGFRSVGRGPEGAVKLKLLPVREAPTSGPAPRELPPPVYPWHVRAWRWFVSRLLLGCVPMAEAEQRDPRSVLRDELARAALVAKVAVWLSIVAWLVCTRRH